MQESLQHFANTLQEYQACASFPITAVTLERNPHIIQPYLGTNIEFCIHGYTHTDITHRTQEHITEQLRKAVKVFNARGLPTYGYRSPYLSRSPSLQAALESAGFSFTSNQPVLWDSIDQTSLTVQQSAGYESALSFYQPWLARESVSLPRLVQDLVEIPVSLPDDEILFDRLGFSASQVQCAWLAILDQSYTRGELFTLQLHPERARLCTSILPAVFEKLRELSPAIWCARLSEIAAWWKALSSSVIHISEMSPGQYHVSAQCPPQASMLIRSVEVDVPIYPFINTYYSVYSTDIVIHSPVRPVIGLSLRSSQDLASFLRQQGLVVEFTQDPACCSLYFDQKDFDHRQERSLLAHIDASPAPLVRLWRWPNGAQSALAITGDIDALTLFDFGLRLIGR
jgi:peptidoglycan/xylan/chitin deacetylase (PgdA/CDA1 family)